MRVACALACTLVAVSAHDGQRRLTSQKRYSCAEAKDRDEIIFDCGGEFISQARAATAHGSLGGGDTSPPRSGGLCELWHSLWALRRCHAGGEFQVERVPFPALGGSA